MWAPARSSRLDTAKWIGEKCRMVLKDREVPVVSSNSIVISEVWVVALLGFGPGDSWQSELGR